LNGNRFDTDTNTKIRRYLAVAVKAGVERAVNVVAGDRKIITGISSAGGDNLAVNLNRYIGQRIKAAKSVTTLPAVPKFISNWLAAASAFSGVNIKIAAAKLSIIAKLTARFKTREIRLSLILFVFIISSLKFRSW
jgi:hypothetical protein